jgi:serine/threonine-protein kinase
MQLIDIACQTLLALEAAHQEKIVHRDLKPDNVFVTKMGDRDDFVKLLDFGISKVLVEESASDLTSTGMVLGTAYYLAPEQARGTKKIDHRVDIYAMGVILYEALTGERPFEGETYNEVMFKIAGEPFKTPRSLNPSISPAVEQVIIKAMAIDPNDRFSTALEMCEALEKAAVSSLAPEASPITDTLADTSYTRARVARTRSGGAKAVGVALLILAIAGVAVALWVFSRPESKTPDDARDRTDRPAPERTVEKALPDEPEPAETREAQSAKAPTESPETAETTPAGLEPKSAEVKSADRERPKNKEAAPLRDPPQKSSKKKKPKDEKVIKGRFGTTFIFEE